MSPLCVCLRACACAGLNSEPHGKCIGFPMAMCTDLLVSAAGFFANRGSAVSGTSGSAASETSGSAVSGTSGSEAPETSGSAISGTSGSAASG
jgi:hypothetical protein